MEFLIKDVPESTANVILGLGEGDKVCALSRTTVLLLYHNAAAYASVLQQTPSVDCSSVLSHASCHWSLLTVSLRRPHVAPRGSSWCLTSYITPGCF